MRRTYTTEVDAEPRAALAHLAREAEAWGGRYDTTTGRLEIPVIAGLRRGWVAGAAFTEPTAGRDRAKLVYQVDDGVYRVQPLPFLFLVVAAIGSLVVVFAPFLPRLFPFLPFGAMAALAGWLFVVARLTSSGPDEFLAAVADATAPAEPPETTSTED